MVVIGAQYASGRRNNLAISNEARTAAAIRAECSTTGHGTSPRRSFTISSLRRADSACEHRVGAGNSDVPNIGLERVQCLAGMSNIALDCGHHFLDVTGEYQLSHGQRETHGLRPVGMRRYRKSIWIGHYINERGPRMLQRLLKPRGQINGVFDSYTHHADRLGKLREVWIFQVRLIVGHSRGFHLEFHHPESAVVEHKDLDGEVILR